jgi:hypothetical protein
MDIPLQPTRSGSKASADATTILRSILVMEEPGRPKRHEISGDAVVRNGRAFLASQSFGSQRASEAGVGMGNMVSALASDRVLTL